LPVDATITHLVHLVDISPDIATVSMTRSTKQEQASWQRRGVVVWLTLVSPLLALFGCSTAPPDNINNGCDIFAEKDGWYRAVDRSYRKWGVPAHVQLAIIHQESSFQDGAKAPRDTLLGFIPWGRKSSAYGYAQAIDSTWEWYQKSTGRGGADRDDFDDAVDFIGWYGDQSHRRNGIAKGDAYNQYLAFHEGHGGYSRRSYKRKKWLLRVANKVQRRADVYRTQLRGCEHNLDTGFGFWPF
jgi:hypothetical protein